MVPAKKISWRRIISVESGLLVLSPSNCSGRLAGSKRPCCRTQRWRARAMSGRCCSATRSVFFYRSVPSRPIRSGSPAGSTRSPGPTSVPPRSYPASRRAGAADVRGARRECAACAPTGNDADRSLRCGGATAAASSPCRSTPEIAIRFTVRQVRPAGRTILKGPARSADPFAK